MLFVDWMFRQAWIRFGIAFAALVATFAAFRWLPHELAVVLAGVAGWYGALARQALLHAEHCKASPRFKDRRVE